MFVQSKGCGLQQPTPLGLQPCPAAQPPQPTESPQLLMREPQVAPAHVVEGGSGWQ